MRDSRAVETYRRAVRKEFAFLKETEAIADLHARSIPLPERRGLLVPVCALHADDNRLIELLARWRDENADAFPTRFPVTHEGTARWLRAGLLDVGDRILFLVLDRHGNPVGHLGYAGADNAACAMEIDNVVRGEKAVDPGLMGAALAALVDWAETTLWPAAIFLRVFADNERAVRYYERAGFRRAGLQPLRLVEDGPSAAYVPAARDEPADRQFLRMEQAPRAPAEPAETILTAGPSISGREASYALDAARGAWNRRAGSYVTRLEQAFADYVGTRYAVATSSCTGALHLALLALGIGPGDEVIVPEITWVATASAVAYTGATPVFADVEPGSWCIDPASAARLVSARTKAIVPVHLYGHPARMATLRSLARDHDLLLVEDAAPAIGAEVGGRRAGSFGDAAAFSFQGAKLLVAGEGGMLVTDSEEVAERVRWIGNHGYSGDGSFGITRVGFKYRMADVQAAVALGQLERADELIEAKRRIFSWYEEGLAGAQGLELAREEPWARSICWMTSVLLDGGAGERAALRERLAARRIDTRCVFPPISGYPIWRQRSEPRPVAARIGAGGLNLPSGVRLRRAEVDYVCAVLREVAAGVLRCAA